eukprot:TRINITY_DN2366_c0_g1_i2.p2 TRINITY_DN2366_c0_g1~~TRINITY_DN2366_c0_g1_i2.p2  ORF type:complete len:314 (+),score=115.72 TRINITY_DN2366_c0_g1_i2:92-943(+)
MRGGARPAAVRRYLGGSRLQRRGCALPGDFQRETAISLHPYFDVPGGNIGPFGHLTSKFYTATRDEPGMHYYSFLFGHPLQDGNRTVFCREAYKDADALLAHLQNVDAILKKALEVSALGRIEAHGPPAELEKVRPALEPLGCTFWELRDDAFRRPAKSGRDNKVAVVPYFIVDEGMESEFIAGMDDFMSRVKKEGGVVSYGFTTRKEEGRLHVHCREYYQSTPALLAHFENTNAPLQRFLSMSKVARLEVHGLAQDEPRIHEVLGQFDPLYLHLDGQGMWRY